MSVHWLPLESNPEVMNKCLRDYGVPEKWQFSDILSLEEDCLSWIPSSCRAILLLFPTTARYIEYLEKKEEELRDIQEIVPDVYFMKQTVINACGTIAMIHAIANNQQYVELPDGTVLKKFLEDTADLSPEEKGRKLEESVELFNVHDAGAQEGQTETPKVDDDVTLHYIALVRVDNKVIELDGRKSGYIVHCSTTEDTFIQDAVRVCKSYTARDPESDQYTALCFSEDF